MPYPFSKGVFLSAEPQYVGKDASPEEMEAARARLEKTLVEITETADNYYK